MIHRIGYWEPSRLDWATIDREIRKELLLKGFTFYRIDIREPQEHEAAMKEIRKVYPEGWHRESDAIGRFSGVWANRYPTEVCDAETGSLIEVFANEIFVLDNERMRHRPPPLPYEKPRWFVRIWQIAQNRPQNGF